MHVELLGQLGQRLLALHGGEGHLRLEGRGVVPARSSRHRLSLPAAIPAAVRQKLHSAPLSRFPEPALSSAPPPGAASTPTTPSLPSYPAGPSSTRVEQLPFLRGRAPRYRDLPNLIANVHLQLSTELLGRLEQTRFRNM